MDNRTKITKSIIIAATTLVLTVAISSSQFVGSAFAQTSITAQGTCSEPNQTTGEKTCQGTVTGLQPAVQQCTTEIKKNAQTGAILSQTGPTCGTATGGDTGTVQATINENVNFKCFNSHGHETGQGGSIPVSFTATSGTVSGGTQQVTTTNTRLVGQGHGSNEVVPGTPVPGQVTGAVNTFTLSGHPDLSGIELDATTQCHANGHADFTAQITSIVNTGETFTFVPA